MSVAMARALAWSPVVARRRLLVAYPVAVAAVVVAVVVSACASRATRQVVTLESAPYQALPEQLTGVRLPIGSAGIITIAKRLPERLAGQERLPYGGWEMSEQFVAGWGAPNGLAGAPPIQIVIRQVDSLGPHSAASGGLAVIADANRAVNIAGRLEIGRDGPVIWSRRSDAGFTLAWGRLDSPWLYVVTASSEPDLNAALLAFAQAAGAHGGRPATAR